MFGVGMLAVIGLGLIRGDLSLETAGMRAAVLLGVLGVVDHLVVPLVRAIVGEPANQAGDQQEAAGAEEEPAAA